MGHEVKSCPSAQPGMEGAQVLGVVEQEGGEARVAYLNTRLPVSDELLAKTGAVPPTKVFRFSANCVESKCVHFEGAECQLAKRIAAALPPVVDRLPPCSIRPTCRWYVQEGEAACHRCPQVTTLVTNKADPLVSVAAPTAERESKP